MSKAKPKRGPGRPPAEQTVRVANLHVRATPEELDRWAEAANRDGRALSDWVRRTLTWMAEN